MRTVKDIPKEAKLISDSQDLSELSLNIDYQLQPDYGCAFVLYSDDMDIMAVWAVESNIPRLEYAVDTIPVNL